MKYLKFLTVCSLVIFFTTACASISQEKLSTADYGVMPATYKENIKSYMKNYLKDPGSAIYDFGIARKGASKDGWAVGGVERFGYIVDVRINAKNSFGGYTGNKIYYFMFSGGQMFEVTRMMRSGMAFYVE